MARVPAITQESVNVAADKIRASGAKPTARSVRQALGAGSMATVLKMLQVWQSGQVRLPDTPAVMPASLQKSIMDFIGLEVAAAKLSLEEELVATQVANSDLIVESERQSATLNEQEDVIDALNAEKATLLGRLEQLAKDLDEVKKEAQEQRAAAESARTETAKLMLRLEGLPRLEGEIDRLRSAHESEREKRVAAEQTAAVSQARLDKTESQVTDLQKRLAKAEDATLAAEQAQGKLEGNVATLERLMADSDAEKTRLKDEVARLTLDAAQAGGASNAASGIPPASQTGI